MNSGIIMSEKILTEKRTDRPTECHTDWESDRCMNGQWEEPSRKLSWKLHPYILKSLWSIAHIVNVSIFTCYEVYRKSYVHKNHPSAKSYEIIVINEVSKDFYIRVFWSICRLPLSCCQPRTKGQISLKSCVLALLRRHLDWKWYQGR